MLKGLAHICFYTQQLEKMYTFYTEVLGFNHGFDFVNSKGERYGFMLHVGGVACLEFFNGEYDNKNKSSYKHFCIEVTDIKNYVAKLRNNNVECTQIVLGKDEAYNSWFSDLDGNLIEIHQYTSNSKEIQHIKGN